MDYISYRWLVLSRAGRKRVAWLHGEEALCWKDTVTRRLRDLSSSGPVWWQRDFLKLCRELGPSTPAEGRRARTLRRRVVCEAVSSGLISHEADLAAVYAEPLLLHALDCLAVSG